LRSRQQPSEQILVHNKAGNTRQVLPEGKHTTPLQDKKPQFEESHNTGVNPQAKLRPTHLENKVEHQLHHLLIEGLADMAGDWDSTKLLLTFSLGLLLFAHLCCFK
ncbi:hypothetical protein INR49_030830, partial [Caranx melampygus]